MPPVPVLIACCCWLCALLGCSYRYCLTRNS
jgi:hypothetical protein